MSIFAIVQFECRAKTEGHATYVWLVGPYYYQNKVHTLMTEVKTHVVVKYETLPNLATFPC